MKYYKLTDQNMRTYGGFQWKLGKWEHAKGCADRSLCTDSWLHCYDSPLLAVLHIPIHADIENPRLFEVEVSGAMKDDNGIKRGFQSMQLMREISLPRVTTEQRIKYGILCAKTVCTNSDFVCWADCWLSGKDRSSKASEAASKAVEAAEAAWVTAEAAAWAASKAAWAAEAAWAAAWAAWAAWAAAKASDLKININLIELAEQAVKIE